MSAWLLRLLLVVVPRVPLRVLNAAAWITGGIAWWLSPSVRTTTRGHMRHVLGPDALPPSVDRCARACVRTAAWYWLDFARVAALPPQRLLSAVQIDGLELLRSAVAAGRGAVLVSWHLGNPEVYARLLHALGFPAVVLTEPLRDPALHALVHEVRSREGVRFLPASLGALRAVHEALERGEVVGGLIDRDVLGTGKPYPLFGERTRMPDGLVALAVRNGAPLLVATVTRAAPGRYVARIEPIEHAAGITREARVTATMERVIVALEAAIRAHPEQWFPLSPIWVNPPRRYNSSDDSSR